MRGRRRRAPTGDSVRLLDERHGEVLLQRGVSRRDEVGRGYAAPGAVTENDGAASAPRFVHVSVREAMGSVDLDDWHAADCGRARSRASQI
jgi:hypothetical protein